MTTRTMEATEKDQLHLAALGDELTYVAERALEAYGRVDPKHAASLRAGVVGGRVRLQVQVVSGGGADTTLEATAIDTDGSVTRLARMTVTPFSLQ